MKRTAFQLLLSCLAVLLCLQVQAQDKPAPSPLGKVYQRVGVTDVEITYSRPGVKDRTIFAIDGLVPYGKLWRTGANLATKISFSTDVKINGEEVPAGEYAIFTIPNPESWTLILNTDTNQGGTGSYDKAKDKLRIEVEPVEFPAKTENLVFAFPEVRDTYAIVTMIWDTTAINFRIDVEKTW